MNSGKKPTVKRATGSLAMSQHPRTPELTTVASTLVPIGMSGGFIRLARDGTLAVAYRLWEKHCVVRAKLLRVQRDLKNCNDRDWLFRFSKTCNRSHKNFAKAIAARASTLEAEHAALTTQLKQIDDDLRRASPELAGDGFSVGIVLREFADGGAKRSTRAVRGEICAQVIADVKALKLHTFGLRVPVSFAILKQQFPAFTVLDIMARPPFDDDDRDRIAHPAQWGVRAVTYATGILKRYFQVTSDETIRGYRKAYTREKNRPQILGN